MKANKIDAEAENRAVDASKQGRIGEGSVEGKKSNLSDSDASALECFDERAAVYEFDARMPRLHAESMALRDVSAKYGPAVAKRVKEAAL